MLSHFNLVSAMGSLCNITEFKPNSDRYSFFLYLKLVYFWSGFILSSWFTFGPVFISLSWFTFGPVFISSSWFTFGPVLNHNFFS